MMRAFAAAAALVMCTVNGVFCQSTSSQFGSIAGRVSLGGRPVQDARVTLVSSAISSAKTLPGAVTDHGGHFALESVPPGSYIVNAFAPALVGASEKIVTVGQGESVEEVDVSLQRGAVITGRVTEASGQPIVNTEVDLIELDTADHSRPPSIPNLNSSMRRTDDRGVYRIYGLPAGRYKVAAGTAPGSGVSRFPIGFYPRTYHPDAFEEANAKVVQVAAGVEVTSVDITIGPFAKTYSASGRIVDGITGDPKEGLLCGYGAIGDNGQYNGSVGVLSTRTPSGGGFLIKGLTPGRYAVFAVKEDDTDTYSEPVMFQLTNSDVSGIEVKLHHGASISGTAVIEGSEQGASPADLSQLIIQVEVLPEALGALRMKPPAQVAADGQFRVVGLRAGMATISVRTLPGKKHLVLSRVERGGVEQSSIELKDGEQVGGVLIVLRYAN
jgi:hypothetical protein